MQTITIGANSYDLVPMPLKPGFAEVAFDMNDTVAANVSPFTMQTQTQGWPGADWWAAQVTMPPMSTSQADEWIAFLAQLRGMMGVFQLGDPEKQMPAGTAKTASGQVLVDGSVSTNNAAMSTTLYTRGWAASAYRLLLPRDYLQIGYRLYMVLQQVNSDDTGAAQIQVWPSIREQPADATPVNLRATQGLFRLKDNKRSWHRSPKTITQLGFACVEAR